MTFCEIYKTAMAGVSTNSGEQASDISPEEENYLRIAHLLIRVAPSAVRVRFDREFYPGGLKTVLNHARSSILEPLKKRRVINQVQWDLLFPTSGTPISETFDLTLMICLIRNLTKIRIEDELPFMGNDVVGADLTTIKYYRNKIMHSNDGLLKDVLFNKWWDETSKAIIQLGGTSFNERCNLWKVGRLERNDRDILNEIRNMIGTFDPVPKGVRKINEGIILEWDIENVAQTRAMKRLSEMVELHNVAVAVGPSGCGKSTAMHFIAVQLARVQDYDIVVVSSPEQMKNYYDPDSKQIFVMHNVFGAYTFEQDKAMKWLEMTKDVKIMLDSNRVKLLASCKTHIFKHQIVEKLKVLSETSCDFSASNYCLTDDERLNIANLYLTEDEIRLLKSSNAWSAFNFFPLLCQCYARRKPGKVVEYFKYPIESVNADLSSMESFDKAALATLFLFVVYNNCIKESYFTEETIKEPLLDHISRNFDLESWLSVRSVKKEMEKLKNSYIEKRDAAYTIIHDKIFDIFVLFCGKHMFDLLIDLAHTDVIRDRFALMRLPKENDMHESVVQISLEQENKYLERLKKDIEQGYIKNVFSNRNLNDTSFRLTFRKIIPNSIHFSLPDQSVFSMLMLMLDRGFCDIVSIFVSNMINLDQVYWDGETALFKAAEKGYLNVIRLLLKQKAYPNVYACFNWLNHIDNIYPGITVNSICDNKCNVKNPPRYSPPPVRVFYFDQSDEHRSASDRYRPESNIQTVKSYLKEFFTKSSKKYEQYGVYKISPLHVAASKGYTKVVELLLSHNAEHEYVTECDQIASPLLTASSKGYIQIVRLLLQYISKTKAIVPERQKFNLGVYRHSSIEISLFTAVENGFYNIVKELLSYKIVFDLSLKHLYWNMVSLAILKGQDNIAILLLKQENDSNFGCENDASPLFKCICEGKTEIVRFLLERNFDPDQFSRKKESPLYRAAYMGNIEIVKLLLQYTKRSGGPIHFRYAPLSIASYEGHTDIVKLLLNHHNDDDNKLSALHKAASNGHAEIVKLLLKHKTNPDEHYNNNETPLVAASENGHIEIVKILLDYKCDPNLCSEDDNESPLLCASSRGHTEIVKVLLDHKGDPNLCSKGDNASPLLCASSWGHTEIVKLLLDHKGDPNLCSKYGNESPLFHASSLGHVDIVRLLLDHNCDPNVCNNENTSPLCVASSGGHTEVVKLLLDYKSDPNVCNMYNETSLCVASSKGETEIVKVLLDYKSDPNVCNKNNESPMVVASNKGHTEIVKLLLNYDCDPNVCNKNIEPPLPVAPKKIVRKQ